MKQKTQIRSNKQKMQCVTDKVSHLHKSVKSIGNQTSQSRFAKSFNSNLDRKYLLLNDINPL